MSEGASGADDTLLTAEDTSAVTITGIYNPRAPIISNINIIGIFFNFLRKIS